MSSVSVLTVAAVVVVLCQLQQCTTNTTTATPCDVNCASGCSQHPGGCDSSCKNGYGIDNSTSTCKPCGNFCDKTVSSCNINGPGTCDSKCITGASLVNNSCILCAKNCLNCTTSGTCDPGSCRPDYTFIPGNNTCMRCASGCSVPCTTQYTCPPGGCQDPGYASKIAISAAPNPANTTYYVCARCDLSCGGSCNASGPNKCDGKCKTGYSLNTTTNTCYACSSNCISNCTVDGPGFCDSQCAPGYAWSPAINDSTKHACYPCATHCTSGCTTKGCCDGGTCSIGTFGPSPVTSTCSVCL